MATGKATAAEPNDPFSTPQQGYGPSAEELNGKLLLITPTEYREGINTVHGVKDAVDCDVVILDGTESGEPEETRCSFMPGKLIGQLKGRIGKSMVLGRMGQGEAKKGQKPPWQLEDPTEEDKVAARAYLASKDPFA